MVDLISDFALFGGLKIRLKNRLFIGYVLICSKLLKCDAN